MKKVLSALFVLALCSSAALANVPEPTNCEVVPADALNGVVLAPDSPSPIAASIYTVTVRNLDNNPIQNATVVFEFGAGIEFCTTADNDAVTNSLGQCTITLRGGGCINNLAGAVTVKANGVPIRNYVNAKSPDFDGAAPNGSVNLADLITFRTGNLCHDYDNNGSVNLADLITFVSAYVPLHSCTLS
jgi:hypothetical protein